MSEALESAPVGGVEHSVSVPAALGLLAPFDSESEEALTLRFSRRARKTEELVFEFTRDPGLLHQYHLIYEREFKAVHKARYQHSSADDEQDRRSHFLVVRHGNFCVGGARLSVKGPRQPHALPIEFNGFQLKDYFPQLEQKQMRYGQIGRICVLPEFRGGESTRTMFWHLYRKVLSLKLDMVFGTAPLSNARAYRQNCIAMGLTDVKINTGIQLPDYPMCEEIKFYLISGSVDKSLLTEKSLLLDEGIDF